MGGGAGWKGSERVGGGVLTVRDAVGVAYDLAAQPLADPRRAIAPARVQRYFLRVEAAGATLHATVTLPDSATQSATAYLFEPNGAPFRGAGHDSVLSLGGTSPGTARLVVSAEDLVPGVYELDVVAPPLAGVTASVQAGLAAVALGEADGRLEASNAGPETAAGRSSATLVGAERTIAIAARGAPAESGTVRVPDWASRGVVDVAIAREQGNEFTDLGVTDC